MNALPVKYKTLGEYILIILGTTMLAFGINAFLAPNDLVTGGIIGLGIIINDVSAKLFSTEIPLWISTLVFNLPLFIAGWTIMGWKFIKRSVFATLYFSAALYFTSFIPFVMEEDFFISAIFGGAISGIGLGFVLRCSATTGGSDIAATIIHKFLRHVSVSKLIFVIDSLIILLGYFVFGPAKALYAIISVFIAARCISLIMEGMFFARAVFIISDNADEISDILLTALDRGVTGLSGTGMHTQKARNVLLCVVSPKEVPKLKELVRGVDKGAFVIVADVREVSGDGFRSY